MKEQHVGDLNDYRKYALIRRLAKSNLRVGVCWMLTPPDNRPDRRKMGYLDQPTMAAFDFELFQLLTSIAKEKAVAG